MLLELELVKVQIQVLAPEAKVKSQSLDRIQDCSRILFRNQTTHLL